LPLTYVNLRNTSKTWVPTYITLIGCDDSNSSNSDDGGEEQIEVKLIVQVSEVQSCVLTPQIYMEQRSNNTTVSTSMVLKIEKNLKIVNTYQSKGLFSFIKTKD
jgi:hypothetical protein